MQIVKEKQLPQFDSRIYHVDPIYITSEKFWDGGIKADSTLKEKAEFYALSKTMADFIKEVLRAKKENVFIGASMCENHKVYAHWANLKNFELFREIHEIIKRNKHYQLSFPEDNFVIDLIVESNFRYFSYLSLYLPDSEVIIQPTCHTELLVYSKHQNECFETLSAIAKKYSNKFNTIRLKR